MRYFFLLSALLILGLNNSSQAQSIDRLWKNVQLPKQPKIETVSLQPTTTALLILDIEERTCNTQRRPRCLESVPRIAALAQKARNAGVTVIYSTTSKGTPETILAAVAPTKKDPIVRSSVDKFWQTDLDEILKYKGIKTVIVTGTAAHGAVLHTATAAGFRQYNVILPVDCLSATDLYTEQATVYLLQTGPGTRKRIQITHSEMITMP